MTTPVSMYAQSSGNHQTNSSTFEAIPGLSITLPEGVGTMGLVFLNVPMPYATGNSNPGGTFGLSINGTMSPVIAGFTYNEQQPPSYGRMPTTLVLGVPLITAQQTVVAMWQNVRGSTVIIDSPATLSATFA
jgi:mannose-binding lectin